MPSRWWQAVRRRPAVFVLLLLISTAATAVAVSGPLLVRAVEQSATTRAITDAAYDDRSVTVGSELGTDDSYVPASTRAKYVLTLSGTAGSDRYWTEPAVAFRSTDNVAWRSGSGPELTSRWATTVSGCKLYVLTSGRCPQADDEVLVAVNDQARSTARLGSTVRCALPLVGRLKLKVVGLYDPDRSPSAPLVRPATTAGQISFVDAESLVITESAAAKDLGDAAYVVGRIELRPGLGQDDKAGIRAGLTEIGARLTRQDVVVSLSTGVPELLDDVDAQIASARILVLVSSLQGLALALFALVIMVTQLTRVRAPEWGIGRLQGVSRSRWWAAVYLEPLVPLLLGVPAGLGLADLAARTVVTAQLGAGTPVELFRPEVLLAAGVAGAVAVVALVAISVPVLRRPLAELVQQRTEAQQPGRIALVLQAMVVVLAVVTGYQVAAGGGLNSATTPLGLLAPGLFALAAALVTVRLATGLVRRTTRSSPRGLAGLVVGRRIARIPSALQPSLVVAIGVALAILSSQVAALSVRNQELRADATVAAQSVLQVRGAVDADALIADVATAEPTGRWAMAAQEVVGSSVGGTSRVVAVDSRRFAAVTRWRGSWAGPAGDAGAGGATADVATALRGTAADPLVLQGRSVTVDLTGVQVDDRTTPQPGSTPTEGPTVAPTFSMIVQEPGTWTSVYLGMVTAGSDGKERFNASLPAGCRQGCRLVQLVLQAGQGQSYQAAFTMASLRTDGQPGSTTDGWLRDPAHWRTAAKDLTVDSAGSAVPSATPDGLSVVATSEAGELALTVRAGDTADPVPALLGPAVATPPVVGLPGVVSGTGFDGQAQLLRSLGTAATLPRSLGDGVLVDLSTLARSSDPMQSTAVSEVWLASGAPADLPGRLARAGLTVTDRQDLGTVREQTTHLAMTRGAVVADGVGFAGLLLALLALVAGRVVGADQRRDDWRIVGRAGVSRARLRRLAAVEVAGPALLGVLLGVAAGLGALSLSAAQLPLVDLAAAGPPLDLATAWSALARVAGGSALGVVVVALVAALVETRGER